jgi:D-3-phosphoglycerate dehydrogenase / 2-oxoglutarate reductase
LKILLTSTSFQDTPGRHHKVLNDLNYKIDYLRGPLPAKDLLPIIDKYDGVICGDDEYNEEVLKKGSKGKLKSLSKYGIGLDKIDLKAAQKLGIKIFNTPGVNNAAVAEHFFALLLTFEKNIIEENNIVQKNKWTRLIGHELVGKSIGIFGLGSVGKEVSKRAIAFGMNVFAFDKQEDKEFLKENNIKFFDTIDEILPLLDYISLNLPLNSFTKNLLGDNEFNLMKEGIVIVNTARAELINLEVLLNNLNSNKIRGYLTDVLENEPIIDNHPLLKFNNVIITPHIGSRNYETVARQGSQAVKNIFSYLKDFNHE